MTKSNSSQKKESNLSKKEMELVQKLLSIWNNADFVAGIIFTLKGDEEIQKMIDYITYDNWQTPSDVTAEAIFIAQDRVEA